MPRTSPTTGRLLGTALVAVSLWASPAVASSSNVGRVVFAVSALVENSQALMISDRGHVVVETYRDPRGWSQPAVWKDGVLIPLPGYGARTSASAVNARGQVVGTAFRAGPPGGIPRAALWQDGTLIELHPPGGELLTRSGAYDINRHGQIVGVIPDPAAPAILGRTHAAMWDHGRLIDLGSLGIHAEATAINDRGEVVGSSNLDPNTYHAFVWRDGVMTDLGATGEVSSAFHINQRGQIIGLSTPPERWSERRAVLWENGRMIDLGSLGGGETEVAAINDRGLVVGSSLTASGERHAFVWADGVMTDLGTLGGSLSGAVAVNNRGQVVGTSSSESGLDTRHAFLWDDGVMTDLGTLEGGQYSGAADINQHGHIVGVSDDGQGATHAVMWTPTHQPVA